MIDLWEFGRGIWIGLLVAVPVGPIGLLCIHRTIARGRLVGFASGLGAATADGLYAAVAAFGLSLVTAFLTSHAEAIRLAGAAFLLFLGTQTFRSRAAAAAAEAPTGRGVAGAWASTFVLTLANPMTVVMFLGVFAALGIDEGGLGPAEAAALVLGVFGGSALWWLALSGAVGFLHGQLDARRLAWLNRLSGAILVAVAVGLLLGKI